MTKLTELGKRHEEQLSAKLKRLESNYHWQLNEEDKVCYREKERTKQLGRSKKVYDRLAALEGK